MRCRRRIPLATPLIEQQVRVLGNDRFGGNFGHQMIVEQVPRFAYWTAANRCNVDTRQTLRWAGIGDEGALFKGVPGEVILSAENSR